MCAWGRKVWEDAYDEIEYNWCRRYSIYMYMYFSGVYIIHEEFFGIGEKQAQILVCTTMCLCPIAVLHEQWMCLGMQRCTHITGNNLMEKLLYYCLSQNNLKLKVRSDFQMYGGGIQIPQRSLYTGYYHTCDTLYKSTNRTCKYTYMYIRQNQTQAQ